MTLITQLGQGAHTSAHGGEDDIARQFQQVRLALHDDGFKAPLKHRPDAAMGAVMPLGVDAVDLSHASAQIAFDRLHDDEEVVVHEAVGVAYPVEAPTDLAKEGEPVLAVSIVQIDVKSRMSRHHVKSKSCVSSLPAGKIAFAAHS